MEVRLPQSTAPIPPHSQCVEGSFVAIAERTVLNIPLFFPFRRELLVALSRLHLAVPRYCRP